MEDVAHPTVRSPYRFFAWLSAALLLVALIGFARTYYLRPVVDAAQLPSGLQQLPGYLHAHGFVLTAWFVLALVQPTLVASRRPDLHRRLGWAGVALAAALVLVTARVLMHAAAGPVGAIPPDVLPIVIASDVLALVVFSLLVTAAVVWRRDTNTHLRLMLLASVAIVGPAASRLPGAIELAFIIPAVQLAVPIAMLVYDRARLGRFHRATIIGTLLIVSGTVIGVAIGVSDLGRALIDGLT